MIQVDLVSLFIDTQTFSVLGRSGYYIRDREGKSCTRNNIHKGNSVRGTMIKVDTILTYFVRISSVSSSFSGEDIVTSKTLMYDEEVNHQRYRTHLLSFTLVGCVKQVSKFNGLFIIRGKARCKENTCRWVSV